MKKALFILSGNLSTTPRALKSILLASTNFECDIIVVNRLDKWFEQDLRLINTHNLKVTFINLGRRPLKNWLLATSIAKTSKFLYTFYKSKLSINANASNKSSTFLWRYLKNRNYSNYSIIFGFSAGSLYPAWRVSKKWKIPFVFDVEDYHPGEHIKHDANNEIKRREYLLKTLLPKALALTSASPLIGEQTLKLIGGHPNHRVVFNSFSETEFSYPKFASNKSTKPLKLVWFSQKISFNRGLEQLFEALIQLSYASSLQEINSSRLSVTLIGDMDAEFFQQKILPFNENIECVPIGISQISQQLSTEGSKNPNPIQLTILPPLFQKELHHQLANFDVGLALEFNKTDLNRQLCLTNKIIAYSQAGLYILATNTPAQKQYLSEDYNRGLLCGQTTKSIATALLALIRKSKEIKKDHVQRYEKAQSLTWEKESLKLSSLWTTLKL